VSKEPTNLLAFPASAAVDALAALPPRLLRQVEALVAHGGNAAAAAKSLGLHRTTIQGSLRKHPEMRRALAAASIDSMRSGITATMALYGSSIEKLAALRGSKNPWLALEASRAVAGFALKALEVAELRDRLAALEDAVRQVREEQSP
jgi:hypothetical protein